MRPKQRHTQITSERDLNSKSALSTIAHNELQFGVFFRDLVEVHVRERKYCCALMAAQQRLSSAMKL